MIKQTINQEIREEMKMNIVNWFKENYKGVQIRRRILKYIIRSLTHEVIHYKIYEKLGKGIKIEFIINISKDDLFLGCAFYCHGQYPLVYNLPAYYPIYIFIEFVHTIFDIIDGMVRFNFFKIIFCLKYFIKELFELKFKK